MLLWSSEAAEQGPCDLALCRFQAKVSNCGWTLFYLVDNVASELACDSLKFSGGCASGIEMLPGTIDSVLPVSIEAAFFPEMIPGL